MATQTGSIDLKAAKKAHDDAEKVATNYVADISNGILVHPDNDNTNGVKITNVVEVIRNSASVAEFGTSARIGENASGKSRTEIGTAGMQIYQNVNGTDTEIANLGYGQGVNSGSGTSDAPYYTLGRRKTTANQYDSSATYSKGDMCTHGGKIYVCTSNITTPEAWNSGHWTYYIGNYSVEEGWVNTACGYCSHAEGQGTIASGAESHAEGDGAFASDFACHAEGHDTSASNLASHAEGHDTVAYGPYSHAEGVASRAGSYFTHAEGNSTLALGNAAHAEGGWCEARDDYAHAQNYYTLAKSKYQTALGKYNVEDNADTYAVIIGNGTADNARSNALTVDWSGNVCMALDTTAASGTDHDLYAAITALGWQSDVIV